MTLGGVRRHRDETSGHYARTVLWVDHHCHLSLRAEVPLADNVAIARDLLTDAAVAQVGRVVTVGTTVEDSQRALALAEAIPGVWSSAGVHPHDAKDGTAGLAELYEHPEVVAVGECGLDYFYEHSPRDQQRKVFSEHIALAAERSLPLIVHSRDAWADTFDVFESEGVPTGTIMHCFTGGPEEAERCLALGMTLSFSGIVTFKGAPEVAAAAATCPSDRMLVETDSPYLAPVPHRGKKNRPAWVVAVGEFVAGLRSESAEVVAAATTANAMRIYGLGPDTLPTAVAEVGAPT